MNIHVYEFRVGSVEFGSDSHTLHLAASIVLQPTTAMKEQVKREVKKG